MAATWHTWRSRTVRLFRRWSLREARARAKVLLLMSLGQRRCRLLPLTRRQQQEQRPPLLTRTRSLHPPHLPPRLRAWLPRQHPSPLLLFLSPWLLRPLSSLRLLLRLLRPAAAARVRLRLMWRAVLATQRPLKVARSRTTTSPSLARRTNGWFFIAGIIVTAQSRVVLGTGRPNTSGRWSRSRTLLYGHAWPRHTILPRSIPGCSHRWKRSSLGCKKIAFQLAPRAQQQALARRPDLTFMCS